MPNTNVKIVFRRDKAVNWTNANPILFEGELGFEVDTGKIKIGDGTSTWQMLKYMNEDVSIQVLDLTTGA